MATELSLSVVVPTYQRPSWIPRAIRSLAEQRPPPTEVVIVVRDSDDASNQVVAELSRTALPFVLRKGVVSEPGFMPPVEEGIRLARGDVVAVMDDDAEALEGWVKGLIAAYSDPTVGAVGGRCINMDGERVVPVDETNKVGYVSVLGRFVGNMYKRPTFSSPRDVQFLMGGCMSFRREVADALQFDRGLNADVAYGYEVDLGLQVGRMRRRVVFDPAIVIRHYSAPRALAGQRAPDDRASVHWGAYNATRVTLHRLSTAKAGIAVAWRTLVGERRAPGVLPWVLGPIGRRLGFRTSVTGAALKGIGAAARDVLREATAATRR